MRSQLTSDYARALEKLAQKSPSYLYFEESGVSKMWNQIIHMEAETARVHNNLSIALQKRVFEQLMYMKDAIEKIRKNVCSSFPFTTSSARSAELTSCLLAAYANRSLWMAKHR